MVAADIKERPFPERGDLVYINFNPQSGHEQAGERPAIVVSPYEFNVVTGFAVVCPITDQQKGYPFEVPLPDHLKVTGCVLADQVKSLDWRARRMKFKAIAPSNVIEEVRDIIHTYI
ncbi:endoribonuclease MazF [Paenibacillus sp. J2TS4]|uniref:endoribonuclease MazF n=1 Tax=Paenibacillus sp. J2TS4 TaxID=2807194 RepID=UPI001AFDBCE7|nr:endoribonuclease MazF [Paenibacillus sp. J2TS4]GIP34078.1 mRNA-degrading endonuclease [Paenibacillus sp. J2TS4]